MEGVEGKVSMQMDCLHALTLLKLFRPGEEQRKSRIFVFDIYGYIQLINNI